MSDELKTKVLQWRKGHDGGRLGVWWPCGGGPAQGSQPIMSVMWDHGGTGELGVFYNTEDAEKMDLICDVFNWAIEQLVPSQTEFYGSRSYEVEGES